MKIQLSGVSEVEMGAKMAELQAKSEAKSTILTNAIKTFCKDLPQVKALIQQELAMQQAQMQGAGAPMGGGEEIVADTVAITDVKPEQK